MLKRLERKIILYHLKTIRDEYGQPRLFWDEKIETRGSFYLTSQYTNNNPDFLDVDAVLIMNRKGLDANWLVEVEGQKYRITYSIPGFLCRRHIQYMLKDSNEEPEQFIVHNIYYKVENYENTKQLRLRDSEAEGYSLDENLLDTEPGWTEDLPNITRVIVEEEIYPKTCYKWFCGAEHLAYVINSDKIVLSKCTSLYQMFKDCYYLSSSIKFGSGAPLNETCEAFFENVNGSIDVDVSGLCTATCTSLKQMFNDASGLRVINGLGTFDTRNVRDVSGLFNNCNNLYRIDGVETWNTSKVTDFSRSFKNTKHMPFINLENWTISSATTLEEMFWITGSRSINIKRFTPNPNLMSVKNMFRNSEWLLCVGCDDNTFSVPNGCDTRYMFNGCGALPGDDNTWSSKTTQNPETCPTPYFNTYADSRIIFSVNVPQNLQSILVYSFDPEYKVQANQPLWEGIYGTGTQNFIIDYSDYDILMSNSLKPFRVYLALQSHLVSYCDQVMEVTGVTHLEISSCEYNAETHYLTITDEVPLEQGEWYVILDSQKNILTNYGTGTSFYLYFDPTPGQSYLLTIKKCKIGKAYTYQEVGIVG